MEYEVKKGDGWYRIAKNLGVNVNDLLQANNAKLDTMLQPGQKLKTSKVTEQPSMTNQWQVVAGQNDAAANWAKQRVDTTMNNINQALAEQEANEQKIQRKASIGTKGVVQQQAKADTIRLQQALLKEGYDLGRWGADGNWGNATNAAIAQAEKDGWVVDGHRLVKKSQVVQTNSTPPIFGPVGPEYAVMAQAQMLKEKSNNNQPETEDSSSFGTKLNRAINYLKIPRNYITDRITEWGASTNNEILRGIASGANVLLGGFSDSLQARANSYLNEKFPGWIDEKQKDQIGKGQPVWTVDKEFGIARYYDADGNLLISSPVGTGLVRGDKSKEGDNKTPTGTYTLSTPEQGANKQGGEASFGPYFYRTNHKNDNGVASGVGLHGTGFPILNGSNVSHGCMRIDNDDIETFYKVAPNHGANTKIIVSN